MQKHNVENATCSKSRTVCTETIYDISDCALIDISSKQCSRDWKAERYVTIRKNEAF